MDELYFVFWAMYHIADCFRFAVWKGNTYCRIYYLHYIWDYSILLWDVHGPQIVKNDRWQWTAWTAMLDKKTQQIQAVLSQSIIGLWFILESDAKIWLIYWYYIHYNLFRMPKITLFGQNFTSYNMRKYVFCSVLRHTFLVFKFFW